MAIHCVNVNSKEFKSLVETTKLNPLKLSSVIAEWQQDNNSTTIPKESDLVSGRYIISPLTEQFRSKKSRDWWYGQSEQFKAVRGLPLEQKKVLHRISTINEYSAHTGFFKKGARHDLGRMRSAMREAGLIDSGFNVVLNEYGTPHYTYNGKFINPYWFAKKGSREFDYTIQTAEGHISNYSPLAKKGFELLNIQPETADPILPRVVKILPPSIGRSYEIRLVEDQELDVEVVGVVSRFKITPKTEFVDIQDPSEKHESLITNLKSKYKGVLEQIRTEIPVEFLKPEVLDIIRDYYILNEDYNYDMDSPMEFVQSLSEYASNLIDESASYIDRAQQVLFPEIEHRPHKYPIIGEYSPHSIPPNQLEQVRDLLEEYLQHTNDPSVMGFENWYKNIKNPVPKTLTISDVYFKHNPLSKFDFAVVSHVNKLLSYVAYNHLSNIQELTMKDIKQTGETIKNYILDALQAEFEYVVTEGLITADQQSVVKDQLLPELRLENSELWDNFINYFSATYKFTIADHTDILNDMQVEEIPQIFDDMAQLKQNLKDSIPAKVKFLLGQVSRGVNELTGLPELVELDTLTNRLINAHTNDYKREDYIRTLEHIRDHEYEGLSDILQEIRDDNNMFNAYVAALDYHLPEVYSIVMSKAYNLNITDVLNANRDSFVYNRDFDTWSKNINILLKTNHLNFIHNKYKNALQKAINDPARKLDPTMADYSYLSLNDILENTLDFEGEFSYESFQEISAILNDIGINITADSLLAEYNDPKYQKTHSSVNSVFNREVLQPINRILADIANHVEKEATEFISDEKGNIYRIAKMNARYSPTRTQLEYLNVNNDVVYSPIYQSYIGRMSKALNSIDNVIELFEKFTTDPRYNDSNLLWSDGNKKNGIFNYDTEHYQETGQKVIDKNNPVNINVSSNLTLAQFDGIKMLQEAYGIQNEHITGRPWDLASVLLSDKGRFAIPASDSGRIFTIGWNPYMGYRAKELKDFINYDREVDTFTIDSDHVIFTKIKNTIMQELKDMREVANHIFDVDQYGNISLKEGINTNLLHNPKHWNGKEIIDSETGIPTGRVFKFLNLQYTQTVDGVTSLVSLNDKLTNHRHLIADLTDTNLNFIINEFIVEALEANLRDHLNHFQDIRHILMDQTAYAKTEGTKTKRKKFTKKEAEQNRIYDTEESLDQGLIDMYVKNYLSAIEIDGLINGNLSEYKNIEDNNKRVNESIKNGLGNNANTTYNSLVVNDYIADSPLMEKIAKIIGGKLGKQIADTYRGIETTDGITFITSDEFVRRSELVGRKDEVIDAVKDFENPEKGLDFTKYNRLIESQKYFYYGRESTETLTPGHKEVLSTQYKNSTVVLTRRLAENLQLGELYDFMMNNNLDEVAFSSARKVGTGTPLNIFDKEGNISVENITRDNVHESRQMLHHRNLLIQLDVKPHLLNEKNKLGVQVQKILFSNINLNEAVYNIPRRKGNLTGNQIKNHYHSLITGNLVDSAINLLDRFGAIENGEIKYVVDEHTGERTDSIDIDRVKMLDFLRDYVKNNEVSYELREALGIKGTSQMNIPLYDGLTSQKFQSILLAMFSNNVTRQEVSGFHVPIIPEVGINISKNQLTSDTAWNEMHDSDISGIDLIDSVKDRAIREGKLKLGFEKKVDPVNGEEYYVAEIIVNPWSANFWEGNKVVDINTLSEEVRTMFGYRMPTEGKQSMLYVEVVGFMKTGASQAMFPFEFINKTGWDFDIDTVFLNNKNVTINEQGQFVPIQYLDSTNSTGQQRYEQYIKYDKRASRIRAKYSDQLNSLYKTLNRSWNYMTSRMINELNLDSEGDVFRILDEINDLNYQKQRIHEELSENYFNNTEELTPEQHDYIQTLFRSMDYVKAQSRMLTDKLRFPKEKLFEKLKRRKVRQRELFSKIDQLREKINSEIKQAIPFEVFKKKPIEHQNTKPARDNRIMDVQSSIVRNKAHVDEFFKPNSMDNITAVGNYINSKYGYKINNMNPHNYKDFATLRDLNMNSRTLKGMSIAFKAILPVLGADGATTNPINFLYKEDKYLPKITKPKLKPLFKDVSTTKYGIVIANDNIGNNKSGNWLDINGDKISTQAVETTANILDAVKNLMGFNINPNTISIFEYLSSTAMSGVFNNTANRFVLAYFFTHQPAVVEYSRQMDIESLSSPNVRSAVGMAIVANKYRNEVLKHISKRLDKRLGVNNSASKEINTKLKLYDSVFLTVESMEEVTKEQNSITQELADEYGVEIRPFENIIYNPEVYEQFMDIDIRLKNDPESVSDIENLFFNFGQLAVIYQLHNLDNVSSTITKAISTLTTDKIGAGPTFSTNRRLYQNIRDLLVNMNALEALARNPKNPYDLTPAVVKELKHKIDSTESLQETVHLLNEFLEYFEIPKILFTPLKVGEKAAMEYYYPSLFRNITPEQNIQKIENYERLEDTSQSHELFDSYLIWSNTLASQAFQQFIPHEYGNNYIFRKEILELANAQNDPYAQRVINNYLNSSHITKSAGLTHSNNSLVQEISQIHEIEPSIPERSIMFDKLPDTISQVDINIKNPTNEEIRTFSRLPVVGKIMVLKADKEFANHIENPIYEGSHILNQVKLHESSDVYNSLGYTYYDVSKSGDPRYMMESLTNMLNSDNPLVKVTAQEMVKMHMWLYGSSYSNSILRFVDPKLRHRNGNYHIKSEVDFSDYAEQLSKIEEQFVDPDTRDNFYKANWKNPTFVPLAQPTKTTTGKIRNDRPKFQTLAEIHEISDSGSFPTSHLIIESAKKVSESIYGNAPYVTVQVGQRKILYKRYVPINQTKEDLSYVYYPVTKTLPHEQGVTAIPENIKYTDTHNIRSEESYMLLAEQVVSNDPTKFMLNMAEELNLYKSVKQGTKQEPATIQTKAKKVFTIPETIVPHDNFIPNIVNNTFNRIPVTDESFNELKKGDIIKLRSKDKETQDVTEAYVEVISKSKPMALDFNVIESEVTPEHISKMKSRLKAKRRLTTSEQAAVDRIITIPNVEALVNSDAFITTGEEVDYASLKVVYQGLYANTQYTGKTGRISGKPNTLYIHHKEGKSIIEPIEFISELRKENKDLHIILNHEISPNLIKYLQTNGIPFTFILGKDTPSSSIENISKVIGLSRASLSKNTIRFGVAKAKRSVDFGETHHEFEGSTIEMVDKLSSISDRSFYIGSDNEVLGNIVNKYDTGHVINIQNTPKQIADQISKVLKGTDNYVELTVIGDNIQTANLTQDQINEKIVRALNHLATYNRDKIFNIHTLNENGVANAVRINQARMEVVVHNHTKSTNKLDVNNPKYSRDFSLYDDFISVDETSYQDVLTMNKHNQSILDSLHSILQFEHVQKEARPAYKFGDSDVLTKSAAKIRGTYSISESSILKDRDIDGIRAALEVNLNLARPMFNYMKELYDQVSNVNYLNMYNLDADLASDIAGQIRTLGHMNYVLDFIDEFSVIETHRGDSNRIQAVNEIIEELKELKAEHDSLIEKVQTLRNKWMHGLVVAHSSNPEFKSRFTETVKEIDVEGKLNADQILVEMTAEEELAQLTKLLTQNEAMSWTMSQFDSAFDTTITVIDTVLKQFLVERGAKRLIQREYTKKLHELMKELYPEVRIDKMSPGEANRMEKHFKSRFIDNGKLISPYDYGRFFADMNKVVKEIHNAKHVLEHLRNTSRELETKFTRGEIGDNEYASRLDTIQEQMNAQNKIIRNKLTEWKKENLILDETTKLSEKEVENIEKRKTELADDTKFRKYLQREGYFDMGDVEGDRYVKFVPANRYKSSKYNNLNKKELEFIEGYRNMISEVIDRSYPSEVLPRDFFPVLQNRGVTQELARMYGMPPIEYRKLSETIANEIGADVYKPMLRFKNPAFNINYQQKEAGETQQQYEERIVEMANNLVKAKKDKPKFKTIADIDKFNEEVDRKNEEHMARNRNFNPVNVMKEFISSATDYEYTRRFENTLMLLLDTLASGEYKELVASKRGRVISKLWRDITDKQKYKTLSDKDTSAYKRMVEFLHPFYGLSNVSTGADRIFKSARSLTSLVFMGANILGAIKNVTKGYHDMLMEAWGREFVDGKTLHSAINEYRGSTLDIMKGIGKDYTENKTVAIIKHYSDLLELRDSEGVVLSSVENRKKALATLNNLAYFGMNATEHFMQYTMLLGMMKSHRIVGGVVMSFNQYFNDIREKFLMEELSEDKRAEYRQYREKVERLKSRPTDNYDTFERWTERSENISLEKLKKVTEKIHNARKNLKETFDKEYMSVYDAVEVKDGVLTVKEGANINYRDLAVFGGKAQKVNQKLHGVYNTIDKMAIRNKAIFDLAFQFRSWVKPNWDRYMGKRWNRAVYSEGLGTYQKGIYTSFKDFLATPIRANKLYGESDMTQREVFGKILKDYKNFLLNARVYYRRLGSSEQANIRRMMAHMSMVLTTSLSLTLLGRLALRSEDEDQIIQNKLLAFTIYELSMIHAEITQFVPVLGWYGFYQRSKQHPLAAEKVMADKARLVTSIMKYPFQDEDQRYYQQGPYKDRSRIEVQASKLAPIYRQKHKWENIGMYTGWYKLYNPIGQWFH